MPSILAKCQECGAPLVSPRACCSMESYTLMNNNDNLQEGNEMTLEELSAVSGLGENALLHRIAMALSERGEDITEIIETVGAAE